MITPPADPVGLCPSCRFVDIVISSRGSVFYRCTLADTDPRFRRYPVLPVVQCAGYERNLPAPPALK